MWKLGPILGIYKSLTDTWMWKLGLGGVWTTSKGQQYIITRSTLTAANYSFVKLILGSDGPVEEDITETWASRVGFSRKANSFWGALQFESWTYIYFLEDEREAAKLWEGGGEQRLDLRSNEPKRRVRAAHWRLARQEPTRCTTVI